MTEKEIKESWKLFHAASEWFEKANIAYDEGRIEDAMVAQLAHSMIAAAHRNFVKTRNES